MTTLTTGTFMTITMTMKELVEHLYLVCRESSWDERIWVHLYRYLAQSRYFFHYIIITLDMSRLEIVVLKRHEEIPQGKMFNPNFKKTQVI